jgi:hypothetical protein
MMQKANANRSIQVNREFHSNVISWSDLQKRNWVHTPFQPIEELHFVSSFDLQMQIVQIESIVNLIQL